MYIYTSKRLLISIHIYTRNMDTYIYLHNVKDRDRQLFSNLHSTFFVWMTGLSLETSSVPDLSFTLGMSLNLSLRIFLNN